MSTTDNTTDFLRRLHSLLEHEDVFGYSLEHGRSEMHGGVRQLSDNQLCITLDGGNIIVTVTPEVSGPQTANPIVPGTWGVTTFPVIVGTTELLRLDQLIFRAVWRCATHLRGGLCAAFAATRLDTGLTGLVRWTYEWEKRDVVVDSVEATDLGFSATLCPPEGLASWLGVYVSDNYGEQPEGVIFPHLIYGTLDRR